MNMQFLDVQARSLTHSFIPQVPHMKDEDQSAAKSVCGAIVVAPADVAAAEACIAPPVPPVANIC